MLQVPVISGSALFGMLRIYSVEKEDVGKEKLLLLIYFSLLVSCRLKLWKWKSIA
jgi:hypothetical protein